MSVRANIAKGDALADAVVRLCGIPGAEREHVFHPARKWRFDVAYPALKIAVEIEGGAFVTGAHSRGAHFRSDCEKYAEAACLGWSVIRVMPEHVRSLKVVDWVQRCAACIVAERRA